MDGKSLLQFAPEKTKSLYIRNQGQNRQIPPKLMLEGTEIEQVERLRYLGVLYDGKLNFRYHLAERSGKALKLYNAIRTTAPKLFDKNPHLLKRIYLGAVEPMLCYGIGAWGVRTKLKSFRLSLQSIQRPFLRVMTRAFRSASTSALQVLAGVMPLGLKAQARWLNFLTKAVGGVHTIGERSFGGEFIERKAYCRNRKCMKGVY